MDIKQTTISLNSDKETLFFCSELNSPKTKFTIEKETLDDKPILRIENGAFYVIISKIYYKEEDVVIPKSKLNPQPYIKRVQKQEKEFFVESSFVQKIQNKLQFEDKEYIGKHSNFLKVYKENELVDLVHKYNYTQLTIPRAFGQGYFSG